MKKFLALTLAMAMVLSMASVAFAAAKYQFDIDDSALYTDVKKGETLKGALQFDEAVYIPVMYAEEAENGFGSFKMLSDASVAKKLKLKADFTTGKDYVEGVKLVKKMTSNGALYFIEIDTKSAPTVTKVKDIIGEITVSGSNFTAANGSKEQKLQIAFQVSNLKADGNNGNPNNDETRDDYYVYEFLPEEQDEEHEIELYGDMGHFVVNTIGQGKLVIKTNVKYNSGIEKIDPDVNYVYFNGNNATFNKIGNLYLKADKDEFIYKRNSDGTLTKIDAKYDKDEEAFVIRTRVIGSYVISEKELNLKDINGALTVPEENKAPETAKPHNPSTGAML